MLRTIGLAAVLCLAVASAAPAADTGASVGHLDIRSTLVGARVYIEDAYVGDADLFVEAVPAGSHMITMRQGSQRIFGQFTIKPGETLMLEGRFEENRIVDLKEVAREEAAKRAEAERKAEAERRELETERKKKEAAPVKQAEKKKKPEPRKTEPRKTASAAKAAKNSEEARRDMHVNLVRVDFSDSPASFDVTAVPRINQKVITNFSDSKSVTGKLIRTKQGMMLCDTGSCLREWTGRFFYIDESGKRDAFLIRWKETVFTGVTPLGNSKTTMDVCLNGDCRTFEGSGESEQNTIDRYVLSWTSKSFIVRRSDIVKEITEAGGKVPDF